MVEKFASEIFINEKSLPSIKLLIILVFSNSEPWKSTSFKWENLKSLLEISEFEISISCKFAHQNLLFSSEFNSIFEKIIPDMSSSEFFISAEWNFGISISLRNFSSSWRTIGIDNLKNSFAITFDPNELTWPKSR